MKSSYNLLEKLGLYKMFLKATPSKALVIRINVIFFAFFLVAYCTLLLRPSSPSVYQDKVASSFLVRCSLRECHHKAAESGVKMKAVLEDQGGNQMISPKKTIARREKPKFLQEMGIRGMKIGAINMEDEDLSEWEVHGDTIVKVPFEKVSELFEWKHLFPEWIDEEEENEGFLCPEVPMPTFEEYGNLDMLVANLPCNFPEKGWARDMFRLQVHLIVANMAAKKGRRDWYGRTKVVLLSKCRPMLDLFRCDDLVRREGDWWYYEPEMVKLEERVSLPMGSCNLALPLWGQGVNEVYDASNIEQSTRKPTKREAYVTILHSSESYVCGAITLAQSLLQTGTKRDLVILIDKAISLPKRKALVAAGWKIRLIKRIRNPRAEKGTYNEYNYSKFRLWQLTDYDKLVFIDSDIVVLRNLDLLFYFPQITATGNDGSIFNSGIMVLEPSNCTFRTLMGLRKEITSYNGGDQGFLNEVFVWWHRLPRRVNFLKNFWSNSSLEASVKNHLFEADPPKLYSIHYLGLKPWLCYRDYDCNWDVADQHIYASDVAHKRWWKLHDSMDAKLQKFCALTKLRKRDLEWDRNKANKLKINGDHWKINITDNRRFVKQELL
ncbi:UDP-glucuronate:xylan alpha-glucuronosyltransferase 2-like isoform X1 [Chenopodium quinoa]|uniref:UDP-glucuronate:xylan alpha-glucuronosyltransferase 2-like isoform X1 n=1 Tax=Chenopodium quinoa TaxID=63459 RepID=UPI000B77705B|nr:UDP-glucuronate:xylan alpha-glucuronosyltransferase 2-like isoform X1 [Chenopodium quinoa]